MARVALMCPDLLFGSRVEGALAAAGHSVTRFDSVESARSAARSADVLVVDLTDRSFDGTALGGVDGVPTLGFYSHVEVDTRRAAEAAGFDLVVPRSRMARETAALVERLAA
ncbi:MAG TPA: hypothetical protein VF712_01175 [Thermoleophilaceae bacterium]|jgi:hypothetical protein